MAEEGAAGGPLLGLDRRLVLGASVGIVLLTILFFFLFRGCTFGGLRASSYSIIYSNLELKEASEVVTRLKDLKISYEIRNQGSAIAVPKDKADQARLGLAEKGLPRGGTIGWEIFDQSRLGATDFDRRIQLIRAISGELGRTIRSLEAIEDARVQIVIPEQKLFETSKTPATASVLLRMRPAAALTISQVNGIVHLVSSSVENLQPENVTVVSSDGHILAPRAAATRELLTAPVEVAAPSLMQAVESSSAPTTPEAMAVFATPTIKMTPVPIQAPLQSSTQTQKSMMPTSPEERLLGAKAELEQQLTIKARTALSEVFPPNVATVRVQAEMHPSSEMGGWGIQRLSATILVDQIFEISSDLKQSAFEGVAGAIGYTPARGDQLELWRVPNLTSTLTKPKENNKGMGNGKLFVLGGIILLMGSWLVWQSRSRPAPETELPRVGETGSAGPMDRVQQIARDNPRQIAALIERWLTEG